MSRVNGGGGLDESFNQTAGSNESVKEEVEKL